MTHADRILEALRATPGLSDGELRQRTGIDPHQQVNQLCRRLEAEGRIARRRRPDGVIGNYLDLATSAAMSPAVAQGRDPGRRRLVRTPESPRVWRAGSLVVLPCSATKRTGGDAARVGRNLADALRPSTTTALVAARDRLAAIARRDESTWMPAWRRYDGTLYGATTQLGTLLEAGQPVVILSGGYGLVYADEPIGWYDRRFVPSDWPTGLLESCLDEIASSSGATRVVSFCARSTGYAEVVRRFERRAGVPVVHVSPNLDGRGGAMVLTPRAGGEALDAFVDGELVDGWRSSDGVRVDILGGTRAT